MGLIDTVKDVVLLVQKTDNVELLKNVLSLQSQAVDIQIENQALRDKVKALEERLAFAGTLRFEPPLYYAGDDGTPYCARCWEADRRAIHLKGAWSGRRWECYLCGKVYLLDDD